MIFIALIQLLFSSSQASDFDRYPTPVESINCRSLDYSSYFQADRAKTNIIKTNPDLTHPNFAGKYLLLKNELLLETLWLIADCKTGRFFHEKLSGHVKFQANSFLAVVTEEKAKDPETEFQTWTGETWVKVQKTASTAPAPVSNSIQSTPSGSLNAVKSAALASTIAPISAGLSDYDVLYSHYPVSNPIDTCKPLDYSSYFRSQTQKENLIQLNPDLKHPNFAGSFLVLRTEFLFETLWLIADCKTGQFFPLSLSGKTNFKKDSALLILAQSGKFSSLYHWSAPDWVQLVDTISPHPAPIENTIDGKDANGFFRLLPNPHKLQTLRFTDLECDEHDCIVTIDDKKQSFSDSEFSLMKKWGMAAMKDPQKFKIDSGRCTQNQLKSQCKIENELKKMKALLH